MYCVYYTLFLVMTLFSSQTLEEERISIFLYSSNKILTVFLSPQEEKGGDLDLEFDLLRLEAVTLLEHGHNYEY